MAKESYAVIEKPVSRPVCCPTYPAGLSELPGVSTVAYATPEQLDQAIARVGEGSLKKMLEKGFLTRN